MSNLKKRARAVAQSTQRPADEPTVSYHRVLLHAYELLRVHGKHDPKPANDHASVVNATVGDFRIRRSTMRLDTGDSSVITITLVRKDAELSEIVDFDTKTKTKSFGLTNEELVRAIVDEPTWKNDDDGVNFIWARRGTWRERFVALR